MRGMMSLLLVGLMLPHLVAAQRPDPNPQPVVDLSSLYLPRLQDILTRCSLDASSLLTQQACLAQWQRESQTLLQDAITTAQKDEPHWDLKARHEIISQSTAVQFLYHTAHARLENTIARFPIYRTQACAFLARVHPLSQSADQACQTALNLQHTAQLTSILHSIPSIHMTDPDDKISIPSPNGDTFLNRAFPDQENAR